MSSDLHSLVLEILGSDSTTPYIYACPGGIRGGVARCRERVPCRHHPDGLPAAPDPDAIFVKVNLNRYWNEQFDEFPRAKEAVPHVTRSLERATTLAADHQQRAESLGRDAFAIRKSREGHASDPESADSGSPIFGEFLGPKEEQGLKMVYGPSLLDVIKELQANGFGLVHPHRLSRDWKPPIRLVLPFVKGEQGIGWWPEGLFKRLVTTTFGQVDVWANDRDIKGRIVHTVNCGEREAGKPVYDLRYAGGKWAAEVL